MARVAFPSFDVQTTNARAGGVASFITQFATMLREKGDEVSIILTRGEPFQTPLDEHWKENYRAWGIDLVEVHNKAFQRNRWPELWASRLSEQVAPLLRNFDIVYFMDWGNVAFRLVREKRFTTKTLPVCVTVMHGGSYWVHLGDREYPLIPEGLKLEFLERYSARHSDYVIAPSRHMLDWARRAGWTFAREPHVLGLPYRPDLASQLEQRAGKIRRIVYFGRLQVLKGYELFVQALKRLSIESPQFSRQLDEIVLLGHQDVKGSVEWAKSELEPLGLKVTHLGDFDSQSARNYLVEHVADALVVVASFLENFPLAVIEASSIKGLNLICSRAGGIPEIFEGRGEAQLFTPSVIPLTEKLRERLKKPLQPEELVGYDFESANRKWLEFHERACAPTPRQRAFSIPTQGATKPSVDVCITYYNKHRHFPQLCQALEHQTSQNFGVIAIDDGSPDPEARAVFDAMADKYRARGWRFFRQPNSFVDAARNQAARHSEADYLLILDADDVPARNTIERMLEAAHLGGDDCLVAGGYFFSSDELPYDLETGEVTVDVSGYYVPLGASLVAGLIEPSVFGGPMILIRRQTFEAVGGYREVRGAAHEDWELHARLAMAGFKTDVLPEFLHFYRQVGDGLAHTSNEFVAMRRIVDTYENQLAAVGLHGTAHTLVALYRKATELGQRVQELEALHRAEDRFHLQSGASDLQSKPAGVEANPPNGVSVEVQHRSEGRRYDRETLFRLGKRLTKLLGRFQSQ
jgi:O-antigen biosynthesis protein